MSRLRRLHRIHAQPARLVSRARKNFKIQAHPAFINRAIKNWNLWFCCCWPSANRLPEAIGDSQVAMNRFILNRENRAMNQPVLLHIVERLEGFLGKLPASIQRPILNDLTPLKELFLQQRSPRFLLVGSNKVPVADLAATIFRPPETGEMMTAAEVLYDAAGADEDGIWCDWWLVEDLQYPLTRLSAAACVPVLSLAGLVSLSAQASPSLSLVTIHPSRLHLAVTAFLALARFMLRSPMKCARISPTLTSAISLKLNPRSR
jgi:hypothetical protein